MVGSRAAQIDVKAIDAQKLRDETALVRELLADQALGGPARQQVVTHAAALVEGFRAAPKLKTRLDAFLQEYGLSSDEGVALMCLAEALLRVPDRDTRDALIADKIAPRDWASHLGEAGSLLVNASTWGLLLSGRVSGLEARLKGDAGGLLERLTQRVGEPVIRLAVAQAMKILGGEFVLGETIRGAIRRGRRDHGDEQLYSFDMLGEGARTFEDAQRYFDAYCAAIDAVAAMPGGDDTLRRSGISVKLSALHPRYVVAQADTMLPSLTARVLELARRAQAGNIKLTLDAEEADRLGLSLQVFETVARALAPTEWPGFGLAIQAYGKRARPVIAAVADLAEALDMRFMVRLVKGAYWDAEIKHAQEEGLEGFPVFTRKSSTDLSYLVCAQDMLARRERLFSQFATHNAHTIAAIMALGEGQADRFEFQRLYGMGEGLYTVAKRHMPDLPPVRIYAPVGGHKDLLAYLVRRLLENGANSSFVNRFMDADIPAVEVVRDPVAITEALATIPHPAIRAPQDLYQPERDNARGLDLSDRATLDALKAARDTVYAEAFTIRSVVPDDLSVDGESHAMLNPADGGDRLGTVTFADPESLPAILARAESAQAGWDAEGGAARGDILARAADTMEAAMPRLMAMLAREAGKTQADALAEVREAVDFLRYYGAQAGAEFETATTLPGPTGEANTLRLCGRGVFAAIAPWNFPLAIFIGQLAAALAAGNAVIAKPAEQTNIIAVEATRMLHGAGVPRDVLMTVLGGPAVGQALTALPGLNGVAFTGSTATAQAINRTLAAKDGPIVPLVAETGGMNAMIVDSTALLEQVCDDVITSAFLSTGQRCSALRVLYLQDDIADAALTLVRGAMDTLVMGDPNDIATDVGPVIDARAKATLDAHIAAMTARGFAHYSVGEAADLPGTFVAPHLFEITAMDDLSGETFGPVLHVVRFKAEDLDRVLADIAATGFGLTLGVHTRMDSRWRDIAARAPIGNIYINRSMVGAVVGSQPFGGQGLSGTGFKAGGPRYLYRFATERALSVNTMASGGNTELLSLE